MPDSPTTHPSLLLRVRDAEDVAAWKEFAELYAPLIHRFACKNGLQDADAADLTQDVLTTVSQSIGKLDYDPKQGRFRSWLFTIARNRLTNIATRRKQAVGSGDTRIQRVIESASAECSNLSQTWEEEYERRLFQWASEQIRNQFAPETWHAFWETAVNGRKPNDVAAQLGMSVGAVYIAKSRVIAKLRSVIERVGDQ